MEKIEASFEKLMQMVLKGRVEQALNSLTVSVDHGHGKESLITTLADCSSSSIVVLPKHLLRCHPFVGRSHYKIYRDDEITEFEQSKYGDRNSNAVPAAKD